PPWPQECIYRGLALSRLDARDGAALALQIAARVSLAPRMLERIVEKTDGVPLFVEELTKAVLESEQPRWYDDDLPGQTLAIPESLKDSLMARLDRLAAVKEVAQIGACIGREFSYDLLRRVVDMPELALLSALEKLTQSGLVNQVDTHRATYSFKHALVQDTAYESLLRAHRQALHSRIANALEEHFPHVVATQPEILAHHFMAASAIESAAEYYLAAARLGFARSTNDEAIGQLNKGIALSARLDDPTKARDLELRLQSTKAHVLANSRGYGAAEVRDAYDRARQLSLADDGRTVVAPGQLVLPVLGGLASYYWTRADVPRALEYMIQRRTLADQSADPNFQLVAYGTLATLTAYAGDLATADHFFTSSFAFFKHATRDDLHIEFGTDPHTRNLAWNGWVRTLIGEHDAPLESVHIALDRAVHLKHPATIGQAKAIATLAATMHGDIELAERWGEECIHYGTEQHLVFWGPLGRVGRASAHAAQGRFDLACAEYQALLDVVERIGGMGGHGWLLVLAAEMYLANGQDAHAEHLLDTAQQLLRRSGERVWTSELHRIQGRLAQARGRTAAASESFDAAVAAGAEVGARHLRAKALKDLHLVSPPTPESTESGRVVSA
ncbi:MAG: hypothetical protein K0U93_19445, partial [Gammaproteobacteria bacterium]|nr:hypothetical protein [Gammaproteobacteria bacterium]